MIPYGAVDCYRYVAIGLLAVLPLASYSEARLMQPVEDVLLAELAPLWLENALANEAKASVESESVQAYVQPPISRQTFAIHSSAKHSVDVSSEQGKSHSQITLQKVSAMPLKTFSIASLLETARQGNVESQYQLGMRYQYGDGVTVDINKANQWLAKAATSGDARSQHALSMFYQQYATNAEGVKKALLWEKKAADHGSADAQYALGVMFKNGRLVRKNEAEARRWLAMAAQQGHLPAQLVLEE
jgi:hypothetical protein